MIPRGYLIAIGVVLLASIGVSIWFDMTLPDRVPVHWNWRGEVDGWGPRWQITWALTGLVFGIVALTAGLPMLGPFRSNFEKFRGTYGTIVLAISVVFLGLQVVISLAASGAGFDIGSAMCVLLGALFAVLGNWLGKVRRNFYVGIRTPWTLANDYVWERTHRLGGKLFVLVGLTCLVAGFTLPAWICFIVMMVGVLGTALISILYSLVCYRRHGQLDDLSEVK